MYEQLIKYIASIEEQARLLREDEFTSMNEWANNQYIATKLEYIAKDLKEIIE